MDLLDPGGEQPVQLRQIRDLLRLDLDQELVPDGPEQALDLSPALRAAPGWSGSAL
ncbi:hypothetical protein [Amycolatopsis sp. SID8362]|uniref:hypothetical protein n=1 Tax=Amycolatopsis sp. SID8362 TaxID=2690346 RepID=UPI00136B0346|nr:hypothetical protein [Amycolatopsis sp. SID8362]NBH09518.1 hypothetical protein [Amycolatopsis sp. SID8362]NED46210.1 hypothetical protein [Amycolatopsis sp. SID8362]